MRANRRQHRPYPDHDRQSAHFGSDRTPGTPGELNTEQLLESLEGLCFEGERALHEAAQALFNQHLWAFPPGYSYLDLIARARRLGWLGRIDGKMAISAPSPEGVEATSAELSAAA